MRRARALALALGLTLGLSSAALTRPARAQNVRELRHNLPIDGALTVSALGFVVFSEARQGELAPRDCRWCDRDDSGADTLNGFDRAARRTLKWRDTSTAARVSDITGFLLTPSAGYGLLAGAAIHDRAEGVYVVDALIVVQAFAFAELANEASKYLFGRERPLVHALLHEERGTRTPHPEDNLSFYSGHTSVAFSIATASGTVASLRGYRLAPLVWATAMPLAAVTGYLRIAADRHYLSDVLTGAVMGAAFGVLMPVLFHGRRDDRVTPITSFDAAPPPAAPSFTFGGGF
jgi:membrane-associated phospholipid phosphatase